MDYSKDFNILDILTPKSQTQFLGEKTTIRQALEKFDYHKFTVVPILSDSGEYITTVSEGDILRHIKNKTNFDITKANSKHVLSIDHYRSYKSIKIDASFDDVYEMILSQNFIPVVDDRNKFIGIIKRKDVLLCFKEKVENQPL